MVDVRIYPTINRDPCSRRCFLHIYRKGTPELVRDYFYWSSSWIHSYMVVGKSRKFPSL